MSPGNLRSLLQNLDRSRLLGAEGAAELWQKACDESDALASAEAFAAWMVKQGNLTRHQADKLLKGHVRFFLDDYKLLDLIGTGRMAGVYKAVHKLGMPVAVKILPPKSAKQPELLARFQREAELALQLDHAHVVKTYHAGLSDGLHYIAMEFLEGETLEDRLKEKGKLPPAETTRLAAQALQALQHLHEKGMVHRDLKPGNLMLVSLPGGATAENPYVVKLLDVGLGRALFAEEENGMEDLTTAGAMIGTPDYTAAEQTRDSHAADIRSDLYSLGCTLYECLAGRVPFPDKNVLNKLLKHAKEMPPPLELSGYPQAPALQAWLWTLLAKNPAERFQTPAEAAAALQRVGKAQEAPLSLDADNAPRLPHALRSEDSASRLNGSRRSPRKMAAIGSAALLLLAGVAYFVVSGLSGPSKPQGQDKEVAAVPAPKDEPRPGPSPDAKAGKDAPKKTEPEPKEPAKKTEPKIVAKKTEPEAKVPVKKTEPAPKVVAKTTDPEPKVVAKIVAPEPKVEVKKIEPVPPVKKADPKKDLAPIDERLPVPPANEIAKAEASVKGVFKGDYDKTKTADRVALALKLFEESGGTMNPAARFVMLREARNVAATAGNAFVALQAAEELAVVFQVSAGKSRAAVADQIVLAGMTPAAAAESTEALVAAADNARAAEDWLSAVVLARAAEGVAAKAQSAVLTTVATAKVREVELMRSEAERVKDHLATLKTNPDDPKANLAVGRFHCLIKQDWDAGAAMLAKGPDGRLKAAAVLDVKASSGSDQDRVAAADAWYDVALSADPTGKFAMQTRAHFLYTGSLSGISGLDKARVEKRLAELQTILENRVGRMKLWIANRQAIGRQQIKKWKVVGGNADNKTFEETPKDGAILIGFHYYVARNGRTAVDGLQPIFLSPRGETTGKTYGRSYDNYFKQTTKAKPGYAIGAIYTRLWLDRVQVVQPVYMKMTDKGLDPNNQYDGPHVGGNIGTTAFVGGDGNFIIGIQGRLTTDSYLAALSVVTLTTLEPKTTSETKSTEPKK